MGPETEETTLESIIAADWKAGRSYMKNKMRGAGLEGLIVLMDGSETAAKGPGALTDADYKMTDEEHRAWVEEVKAELRAEMIRMGHLNDWMPTQGPGPKD